MISTILMFLLKVVAAFGIGMLLGMVINLGIQTLQKLMARVKEKMAAKAGRRVVIIAAKKVAAEAEKVAQESGNTVTLDELTAFFDEVGMEGTIEATMEKNGKIEDENVGIYGAQSMDGAMKKLLDAHEGELVIAN